MSAAMEERPAPASPPPGEADLVARARGGDHGAFAALYRAHHPRVYAAALRMMRHRERAEDVAQDAFVEAWRALPRFRGESTVGTWLYGVAVRTALRALRAERRRLLRVARFGSDAAYEAELRRAIPDTRIDVERALATLPDRARATLLLHLSGFNQREIAEQLGVTIGTVKAQLHRARRLVLEVMER